VSAPAAGRRRAPWTALAVAGLVIGTLYGRALVESKSAYDEAQTLIGHDERRVNAALRHAVEWYAPGNGYSARAAGLLMERGEAAVADPARAAEALDAFESLRTGVLVTRSLWTPYLAEVERAEAHIASLRGAEVAARAAARGEEADPDAERARQLALLVESRGRAPHPWWSLLASGGFAFWIFATWRAIRGPRDGSTSGARAYGLRWAILSLAALAAWLVGLTSV
jgi:hypothetical protein